MFIRLIICLVRLWTYFIFVKSVSLNTGEINEFLEPSYCAADEYFNVNQLKCISCDSDKHLVPSKDGYSCVCNHRSKIKKWNMATFPLCEPCKDDEMPTKDQIDCIPCPRETADNSTICEDFRCPLNTILVERTLNGSLLKDQVCLKCDFGLEPSSSQANCIPCMQTLVIGQKSNCTCREGQLNVNGICIKDTLKNWPDERTTYTVNYENGKEVDSRFFRENLLRGILFCKMGNQTACQLVGNMCTMVMYNDIQKSSPCSLFSDHKRIPISNHNFLPWMYYGEGEGPTVLSRKRITAQFNLDSDSDMSYLNLTGVIYHPNGRLKKISKIFLHTLQLCPMFWTSDSNFRFAARYYNKCKIPAKQLLHMRETEFMDLFLRYTESNGEILYALPVLIYNIKMDGSYVNKENDQMQWQLVRRFFLIDKLSGFHYEEGRTWRNEKNLKVVRYAQDITLHVKLQGRDDEGKIFVPYLAVRYEEITNEDIANNVLVSLSFKVDYQMENSLSHALEVCMGVFSGLAVVWSSIRTWSHSKRSGRVAIDFFTLAHLILFACGNLANVFFVIVFCASLNIFIFFKGQSVVHLLLPKEDQEEVVKLYLIFAFVLKMVEMAHLMYEQITIDIFFIDWERPRARNLIPRTPARNLKNPETEEDQPVSIWRTYFVANEWNEIQTKRKLNINIHLLLTVLVLKVFGLEYWTTSDPDLLTEIPDNSVGTEFNFTCRFAVGCLVYLIVYFVQWLFMALIYERYIKNGIQEFVDMCSMANISVFILAQENYGYYIHGRSAHGFADTDMQNIINQLQREEEDLVGHRGLMPGTDQQTFEMTVPTQLRAYYTKVMEPLKNIPRKRLTINAAIGRGVKNVENVDRSVQAYHNMNRFLAAFLEHALKDLDYEVREKLFSEHLLGIEFTDTNEKGVFYSDSGHSFDNVLFYGNEFTLLSFDIMLFSFIVVLVEDYLVACVVTAALAHAISMIRDLGGRKNLAKKTLIDERFLI